MLQRILSGLGLSAAGILVLLLGQILAVPIFLTAWGAQLYGEWLVLTNLVAGLSVLNFGVQTYVINRLIAFHVRGEMVQGTQLLHAALRLYIVLCSLAVLATLGLVASPEILTRLRITALPPDEARLVLGMQGLLVAYALVNGMLVNLFRVNNQLPRQLAYRLVERVVYSFCPITIAVAGGYPVHATLATAVLIGGIGIVAFRDVNRRSPFKLGLASSSWKMSLSLLGPSLVFFLVSLASTLLTTGTIVILSTNRGAATVTIFSTTLLLSNFVVNVMSQGLGVLWPEITAASARTGNFSTLAAWHRLALKLTGSVALVASAVLALLGADVLRIWTRGRIEIDPVLNLLLALYLLLQVPGLTSSVFGLATNRQNELFKVQVVTAVVSLLLAVWLVPSMGVRGAALALIGGQLLGTPWTVALACRWTSDSIPLLVREVLLRGAGPAAAVLLIALAAWMLSPNMGGHVVTSLLLAIMLVPLAWVWLSKAERELVNARIVRVLRSNIRPIPTPSGVPLWK